MECRLDDDGEPIPVILRFTSDTKRLLYEWQHRNAEMCDNGDERHVVSFFCKLEIYIIRFSLLLRNSTLEPARSNSQHPQKSEMAMWLEQLNWLSISEATHSVFSPASVKKNLTNCTARYMTTLPKSSQPPTASVWPTRFGMKVAIRSRCFSPAISTLSFAGSLKVSIVSSHIYSANNVTTTENEANQSNQTFAGTDTSSKRMWPRIRTYQHHGTPCNPNNTKSQTERKLIKSSKREN